MKWNKLANDLQTVFGALIVALAVLFFGGIVIQVVGSAICILIGADCGYTTTMRIGGLLLLLVVLFHWRYGGEDEE